MRANRKMRAESKNQAQVGIGTMIVFIATVLVAAIAAGVLIDTSGKLQERSGRTGDQATKQVASNFLVERVTGNRTSDAAGTLVTGVQVYLGLAAGASKVDVKQVQIQLQTPTRLQMIGWNSSAGSKPGSGGFTINEVRDADNSIDTSSVSNPMVMTSGDLVYLDLGLGTSALNQPLDVRTSVELQLFPEAGTPARADFTTPESYGTDTQIEFR